MYAVMVLISILVRQFCLPNPFECFGNMAWFYNLIAEPIIHAIARGLVGTTYHSGEDPAWGSFLYMVAYASITGVLSLMGIFSFAWWWVATIAISLVAIGALLRKLWGCLSGKTW